MSKYWRKNKDYQSHYNDREYIKNREKVLIRDLGICVRCWELFEVISMDVSCDHYIPLSQNGDHSLQNMWLLCNDCHLDKTIAESHGKHGFRPIRDQDGWPVDEKNWQDIICQRNQRIDMAFFGSRNVLICEK